MFGFGDDSQQADAYQQVYGGDDQNKSSWSHELIAGAASFEAMKAYEKHQNGVPESHERAKEIFAAIAGAEVDKLAETKGLDAWDREKLKRQERRARHALSSLTPAQATEQGADALSQQY